jgi:hypothetical protein
VGRKSFLVTAVALSSLILGGCAVTPTTDPTSTDIPLQTFDPALIPTVPAEDALALEPYIFESGYGDYIFRVGTGPAWCSINPEEKFVVCEQNEADATYDQVPAPTECKLSYGYQIRLNEKAASGKDAQFNCASGLYADPSNAQTLNPGETLTVGELTCFVVEATVRCDNKNEHYIVLGPEVWALG